MTVLLLAGALFVALGMRDAGKPDDLYGYQLAAERLSHGQSIYLNPGLPMDRLTYRHAPWLAVLWVPLGGLPGDLGPTVWRLGCLVAAMYVIVALARLRGPAGPLLAAMALPLLGAVPQGNVGPLMIALLVARRADPWSVAIAASLKLYPALLVLGYVAERRWRDAILALGLTAVLWLPALWLGIGDWTAPPSTAGMLPAGLLPWLAPLGVGALVFLAIRRSRWTWLAIGAAIPIGVPHYVGPEYVWLAALPGETPATVGDRSAAGDVPLVAAVVPAKALAPARRPVG